MLKNKQWEHNQKVSRYSEKSEDQQSKVGGRGDNWGRWTHTGFLGGGKAFLVPYSSHFPLCSRETDECGRGRSNTASTFPKSDPLEFDQRGA